MNRSHECQHAHAAGSAPRPHASACGAHSASFEQHPAQPAPPRADLPAGTIYTCPMHPEVRQIGPGHCPKCGMALEPLMPTAVEDDGEVRSVQRRFLIALAPALPGMFISLVPPLSGKLLHPPTAWALPVFELAFRAPVGLWGA